MLSYIGGKSRIGKWIVPFYDKNMEVYVETFGGMFWCFFNMDLKQFPNLKKVVYNDFNPLNYNLFKCVQNPDELLKAINSIDCQKLGLEPTPPIVSNLNPFNFTRNGIDVSTFLGSFTLKDPSGCGMLIVPSFKSSIVIKAL